MEENKENKTTNWAVNSYITKAKEKIVEMIKNKEYTKLLDNMARLYKHSLNNEVILMTQKENITFVDTVNGWKSKNVEIKEGEQPLKVIKPSFIIKEEEYTDKDGNTKISKKSILDGYRIGFEYDVSQTNCDENFVKDIDKENTFNNLDKVVSALENCVREYKVNYSTHLGQDEDGYCDKNDKKIVIRDGMDEKRTLQMLIYEVSDILLETYKSKDFKGITNDQINGINELDRISTVYVISKKLGLETDDLDFSILNTFTDEMLQKYINNLNVVRSVCFRTLNEIEQKLELKKELTNETQSVESQDTEIDDIFDTQENNEEDESEI